MEEQNKVTQPYKGMVQDASPLHQPEGTYSFALNAVKDSDNNQNVIANEEGLASKFITPAGSTCIGSCYVGDNTTLAIFLDVLDNIHFCLYNDNQITVIGETLYSGPNTLSFDTKHPLDITFRLRKGNQRTIYFTDGINPPRYINLDNINNFRQDPSNPSSPLDPDKVKLIKTINTFPTFSSIEVLNNGQLLSGSYNIGISFLDEDLNSTKVISVSNIVNIYHDKYSQDFKEIWGSTNLQSSFAQYSNTSKSIKVTMSTLDDNFTYYRLYLIEASSGNGIINNVYYTEPIPVETTTFELTGLNTPFKTTIEQINEEPTIIATAKHIEQLENRLIIANTTEPSYDLIGLQQYASKIRSIQTTKTIKLNDINKLDNPKRQTIDLESIGYLPGELYAFDICYVFKDGFVSPAYHIPGKPSNDANAANWMRTGVQSVFGNELTNVNYDAIPGITDFWGKDYKGNSLQGTPVRHHRFPFRHNGSGNVRNFVTKKLRPTAISHTFVANCGTADNGNMVMISNITEADVDVLRGAGPGVWALTESAYFNEGVFFLSTDIYGDFVDTLGQIKQSGVGVPFTVYFYKKLTEPLFDYEADIYGIQFSDIELPTNCIGYFICRKERIDGYKTVVDTAILSPMVKDSKYTAFAQFFPEGTTNETTMYAFTNPEFKFREKEFTPTHINVNGYYKRLAKITDGEALVQDAYPGTTYNATLAKRKSGKDDDGFSLHVGSRYNSLAYFPNGLAGSYIQTVKSTIYLNAASQIVAEGKEIYNVSSDNKIGIINLNAAIPILSTESVYLPFVTLLRTVADPYGDFRTQPSYKEHTNIATGSSITLYHGDGYISSMSPVNTYFYRIALCRRTTKTGIHRIMLGINLIISGIVGSVIGSIYGVVPVVYLGVQQINWGLSFLKAGFDAKKAHEIYESQYEKGLKDVVQDTESESQLPVSLSDDVPENDDEIQYFSEILSTVWFESPVNMNMRLEPTYGVDLFIKSPTNFNAEVIQNYFINKLSVRDTENQNGVLYQGFCTAEFYEINKDYFRTNKEKIFFPLPLEYILNNGQFRSFPHRVYYSEQSFQEELTDNFRVFLPNNYRDIEGETGKITDLFKIQNNLFIHTEEALWSLPQNLQERVTGDFLTFLGTGEYFSVPPRRIIDAENGNSAGCIQKWATLKTPYGVFFVCEKQNQIYNFNGQQLKSISDVGMKAFFNNNMQFDYLKAFLTQTGNEAEIFFSPFDRYGIGYLSVYDVKNERILITKKDYELGDTFNTDDQITHYTNFLYLFGDYQQTILDYETLGYEYLGIKNSKMVFIKEGVIETVGSSAYVIESFIDKSWTISYNIKTNTWVSFHSYTPKKYINSGSNIYSLSGDNQFLWKHNTVGLYNNYYGVLKPFIVEIVSNQNPLQTKVFDYIKFLTEASIYDNITKQFREDRYTTFNKAILYNARQSTGLVELSSKSVTSENYLMEQINNTPNEALLSRGEKDWTLNNFRDYVISQSEPLFSSEYVDRQDDYFIDKVINTNIIDEQKSWEQLESFRDKYLIIRFIFDTFDNIKLLFNFSSESDRVSQR